MAPLARLAGSATREAMAVGLEPARRGELLGVAERFAAARAAPRLEASVDSPALMIALLGRPSAWMGYWRYRGYLPR